MPIGDIFRTSATTVSVCPGCAKEILPPNPGELTGILPVFSTAIRNGLPALMTDADNRLWHEGCAKKALADGFRTPYVPAADSERAFELDGEGEIFPAPFSFRLRAIVLSYECEVSGLFVGAQNMFLNAPNSESTFRARDLPAGRLDVDADVPLGLSVSVLSAPGPLGPKPLKYKILGERRPESEAPAPLSKQSPAVFRLRTSETVSSGATAALRFTSYGMFRGERLVCDDWPGWEVVGVQLGTDEATRVKLSWEGSDAGRLKGRDTPLPTFFCRPAEQITYYLRNNREGAATFDGRVYGLVKWEPTDRELIDDGEEPTSPFASDLDLNKE